MELDRLVSHFDDLQVVGVSLGFLRFIFRLDLLPDLVEFLDQPLLISKIIGTTPLKCYGPNFGQWTISFKELVSLLNFLGSNESLLGLECFC